MFTIKSYRDYYNEEGRYKEFITYRTSKSEYLELIKDLRKEGYDKFIVWVTGTNRIVLHERKSILEDKE